ncbi:putative GTP-binding protein 6 [Dermatophagoides farinae]|uniref:GTP-binding protein 6 n=1 Tax=Dermatophagoides farinae TaxID=6954 RepID=A0A922HRG3_DERFA|nr:putative GTP-binding protein 6 [Dermatophagoides farinae]
MIPFLSSISFGRLNSKILYNVLASSFHNNHHIQCRSIHQDDSMNDSNQDDDHDLLNDVFQYNLLVDLSPKNVVVIMPRMKKGDLYRMRLILKKFFGSTNRNHLRDYVRQESADAVVFAINVLRPRQHHFFRNFFDVEVYDRFSTVLKIFRERCSTKEAKLQLALAELEYVKKNLHHLQECDFSQFSFSKSFGGNFDTFYQIKKQIIQERESRLKRSLSTVTNAYEIKRKNRTTMEIPTVAVVGYTNSGKTSLIKALSHDTSLQPEDRLFATLDVTTHQITLPSKMKALLIDTIGFISEIPTTLVHCFRSTLREICTANLIVHVVDASHPNRYEQINTVHQTLKEIEVPEKLLQTMIKVSNKVDKLSIPIDNIDGIAISATERIGLDKLARQIQKGLIENTERLAFEMRVANGGEQYQWLYREASAIVEMKPDPHDANFLIMKVLITKSKFGKFVKLFHANLNSQ